MNYSTWEFVVWAASEWRAASDEHGYASPQAYEAVKDLGAAWEIWEIKMAEPAALC